MQMRVRPALRAVFLVLYGLTLQATAQPADDATVSAPRFPVYSAEAFGGRLIGTDHGEWGGKLEFEDPAGGRQTILEENIRAIIKNQDGVFVFTGLAHMGLNRGAVYVVNADANSAPRPALFAKLPGAPVRVHQEADGTARFLISTGPRDAQGKFVYACYQLAGKVVERGTGCLPPP